MTDDSFEIGQDQWLNLPASLGSGIDQGQLSPQQTRVWPVVLAAKKIRYKIVKESGKKQILVHKADFARACEELNHYECENLNWPPPPPEDQRFFENIPTTIWALIVLAIFHNITTGKFNSYLPNLDWVEIGNAAAGKILHGEWWRLFTALTLHSGPLHLVSNLLIGGIFMIRLCRQLGAGPAWLLVLLSGAGGNLLNALIQSAQHRSIGASTAVFGAVGLLAVLNMFHYRHSLWKRWPLPVAAALALLGLLGTAGENTDVMAHLFGFVCGVALGLLAGIPQISSILRRAPARWGSSILALALITGAWLRALG